MTSFLLECLQYELACCCPPSCRKIAAIAVSETILFRVMPLQNEMFPSNPLEVLWGNQGSAENLREEEL